MARQTGMNDPNDIKIFILFLLDSINYPMDYSTIHDIILQSGYVGQFDFAQCFSELKERGHILEESDGSETYYAISATGRMVASELQGNLMQSIRDKSLKCAMRFLSFQKRNAAPSSSVTERPDRKYNLHCAITEPNGSILSLDLCVSSRLQAEEMKARFDKEPEGVYRRLMAVISGDPEYVMP